MSFYAVKDRENVFAKRAKEIFEGDTFLKKDKNLLALEEEGDEIENLSELHEDD